MINSKTRRARPAPALVFAVLAIVVLLFFSPILPTYFLADDYNYVGHLLVNARQYAQGEQLGKWFIDFSAQGLQNPGLSIFFRPVVQWLWLTDFLAWGTDAAGYHLTNILLHALNSFLVYILAWQILRHRFGAVGAGLLFALHPIHANSVAWIADRTDVLSAFFYLSSAVFFIFYRQRSKRLYGLLSLIAFALAIGTKENTVALPIVLLFYDLLFTFSAQGWKIFKAQLPYWLVLVAYVGLRFLFLGQFGRNTGGGFLNFGVELFAQFYVLSLIQPFVTDMTSELLLILLAVGAILLVIYRQRKEVWFGALWITLSLLPAASAAYVAPRLVYAASAGLTLALAAIFIQPLARPSQWSRAIGLALFLIFLLAYGIGLATRVDNWAAAGTVARIIPTETMKLHPTLPSGARLYFAGVPNILRGIYIYTENFGTALQIAYRNPSLWAESAEKFPIVSDALDRTLFLEYRKRTVTERQDILRVLEERKRCLALSSPAITWDFSSDAQGWEAWNDLALFQVRDRALFTQSLGNDPYMGGPMMDVPAIVLGEIEIEMQVRAGAPTTQGAIFWATSGQDDFSPARQQSFAVQTDGFFHTYRVDLARDGKLNVADRIARLRFDPTEMPAEIAIKSIRVYVHCAQSKGVDCECPR